MNRLQRQRERKLIRTPLRLAWKFRRGLFIFGLILFVINGINYLAPHAMSPVAKAELDQPAVKPTNQTQFEEIKAYIRQVFGKDADNAFKILACENHSLNPLATGKNSNGTYDRGIFQINDVHGVPAHYLYDYKININIAYNIFKEQGWSPWACESVWHALERNDTI